MAHQYLFSYFRSHALALTVWMVGLQESVALPRATFLLPMDACGLAIAAHGLGKSVIEAAPT